MPKGYTDNYIPEIWKDWLMKLCSSHKQNPFIDSGTQGHRNLNCPICLEFHEKGLKNV